MQRDQYVSSTKTAYRLLTNSKKNLTTALTELNDTMDLIERYQHRGELFKEDSEDQGKAEVTKVLNKREPVLVSS